MTRPFVPTLYANPIIDYDYKNWAGNHIWLHKQPLPLWGMMLGMKLFGKNEWALRLPSILLSTLAIVLTFFIGRHLFDSKTGLLAAFFHAVNGLIIEITAGRVATDHIDLYFLFFIELSAFLLIIARKKKHFLYIILSGISCGMAILSKWLPALIVIPAGWLILRNTCQTRQMLIYALLFGFACLLTFLPWQIYIQVYFPEEATWAYQYNRMHITEVLSGMGGGILYQFNKAPYYME